MDDKRIVTLYLERSETAISETEKKYGRYCLSIAKNILGNQEDAEECVNDTYLDVWSSIPPHKPTCLSTFLGKITRRRAIDRVRTQNRDKRGGNELTVALDELNECIPSGQPAENQAEKQYFSDMLSRSINSFLGRLGKTERDIFICRYWYTESIRDISRSFGFSESKVKSMLMRTRQKLREHLEKEDLYEKL